MKLLQLKYFLDAVECHSLHKSAERCNISVQGLSKAIKTLEEELGVVLVTRTSKGVYLTETGEYLVEKFKDIVRLYDEVADYCNVLNDTTTEDVKGEVRLAVTTRFVDSFLSRIVSKFNSKYPAIKVYVENFDNIKIIEMIQQESNVNNLGIVSIIESEASPFNMEEYILNGELHLDKFYQGELFMCGLAQTVNKFGDAIRDEDVAGNTPIVSYRYGVDHMADSQYQLNSIAAQKEMITHHGALGAYTLDEFHIHFNKNKYAYIPYEYKLMLYYGCIQKNDVALTQAEKLFVTFLLNNFK